MKKDVNESGVEHFPKQQEHQTNPKSESTYQNNPKTTSTSERYDDDNTVNTVNTGSSGNTGSTTTHRAKKHSEQQQQQQQSNKGEKEKEKLQEKEKDKEYYGENKKSSESHSKNTDTHFDILGKLEELEKKLISWEERVLHRKRGSSDSRQSSSDDTEPIHFLESNQSKAITAGIVLVVVGLFIYFLSDSSQSYLDPTLSHLRKMQDDIMKIKEKTDYLSLLLPKDGIGHQYGELLRRQSENIQAKTGTAWENMKDSATDALSKTKDIAEHAKDRVRGVFGQEKTPEPSWWDNAWSNVKDYVPFTHEHDQYHH